MQRVGQKEFDDHLPSAQLPRQPSQASFVLACGDAQCDLFAQVGCELHFQTAGSGVVNQAIRLSLAVQLTNFFAGWTLHTNKHAADLAQRGLPRAYMIVNRLPATEVEITHTKISTL